LYHSCPSHDNISDISTDPSQVLRIDCDVPVTIEDTIDQTIEHRTTSDPMTTEQTKCKHIKLKKTFADGNILCKRMHSNVYIHIFKNLQLECVIHYILPVI
jgi:hypothetical protein